MADVAKRLSGPSQLTAAAVTKYTVPTTTPVTTTIVRSIVATNVTGSAVTFTLSVGTDASGTRVYSGITIPAYGVLDWSGFLVLATTEIVQAYSNTASAVNLVVSGVEVTT